MNDSIQNVQYRELRHAIYTRDTEKVKLLINQGIDVNYRPTVEIINNNATVHSQHIIEVASYYFSSDIIRILVDAGIDITPLKTDDYRCILVKKVILEDKVSKLEEENKMLKQQMANEASEIETLKNRIVDLEYRPPWRCEDHMVNTDALCELCCYGHAGGIGYLKAKADFEKYNN